MTTRSLPATATLRSLKRDAKVFLKALKAGDASAAARARPYFADPATVGLQDAQLVLAREYGFSGWTKLKGFLEARIPGAFSVEQLIDRFLALVSVSYRSDIAADPARYRAAAELLEAHPEITGGSIHAAAACGDAGRVGRLLDRDPGLLDARGGPFQWTPLLYAAYARLPGRSSLPAARLLVERGADVNAHWLDDGQYRFTVLTGVFGEGEAGRERQPEHPDCDAFARLLLAAGAAANDSQALYNRMFEPDDRCLALLIAHGLSPDDRNTWLVRADGGMVENSERVFDYQLAWALKNRMAARVRLLVENGADVLRPVDGRTPYEWAMLGGDTALAAFLVSRGAAPVGLSDADRLARAISAGADAEAGALAAADPALVDRVQAAHPALLHDAAGRGERAQVALMLALGFDVNRMTSRTPLHEAALHGELDMVKALIGAGADPTLRDPYHHAPPIGWADYNGHAETVAYLKTQRLDIFAAIAFGLSDRVAALLDADPSLLGRTFRTAHGRPDPSRDGLMPLGFAVAIGATDMAALLLSRGADPRERSPAGESLVEFARRLDAPAALRRLLKEARAAAAT
ncbi:ankyrin repeat domain-containing protein [Rhizobium sp. TRM95111]|uniref:ankyrin repeat domain-containing protein n=1 Tax=Rhizobium alarense TaxID=2846851 RepID=UPI001F40EA2A|nr:ankyrin repeat domain-containing protein [Rhizobium alarense]MCF3641933.1 ankyrin repeat domain-containing protein [Rhizobium alarense]